MVAKLAATLTAVDVDGLRLGPAAVAAAFAAAMQRSLEDPWINPNTQVSRHAKLVVWNQHTLIFHDLLAGRGGYSKDVSYVMQCQPQQWSKAPVDTSDADYFAGLTTTMTYIPSRCGLTVRPTGTYPTDAWAVYASHLNKPNILSHASAMGATATDGAIFTHWRWSQKAAYLPLPATQSPWDQLLHQLQV